MKKNIILGTHLQIMISNTVERVYFELLSFISQEIDWSVTEKVKVGICDN